MFDPGAHPGPRVFALPCGVDFPRALVAGLLARLPQDDPMALARVELVVNTNRMARRIRAIFDAGPPRLLPRLRLLGDLDPGGALPPPVPPLRRKLELAQLIARLLAAEPDLAARSAVFDLADSLIALIDEMQGEGVAPQAIRALDVSDQSGHWARMQKFIAIAETFMADSPGGADARQRRIAETLIARWRDDPPRHPVILAGSTGSRGATLLLMQAIADLPQGALVLPGFDFDLPAPVWAGLDDALTAEDHPQFRFRKLMDRLQITADAIRPWIDPAAPGPGDPAPDRAPDPAPDPAAPPAPARNRLVSLALRPAPVTDAWRAEGPALRDLEAATADLTLLEAPSPRAEALAIALRLRAAVEAGETAALITPDRMLTRQVAAALDRWNIVPDDSAGQPLHLSPPGRFLRHVADLFAGRLTGAALLTLLKHPLCHTGPGRGDHLRLTRDLELHLRKRAIPFPGPEDFAAFAARLDDPAAPGWADWLARCFCGQTRSGAEPLARLAPALRALAEAIAGGSQDRASSGTLWHYQTGQAALAVLETLIAEAGHGGEMTARDFTALLDNLLQAEAVHDRDADTGTVKFWGTIEARVQGADLVILGGLNEGVWPESARPDPWLNRRMRLDAGLLLPERRIGLAAHDFQQAIAAPRVWLTRARRSDDAETVASRWLNRLTNLLDGLDEQGGRAALAAMRARGATWLAWAEALERPEPVPPAPRPSPRPPVEARPRQLSVTEIKRLIRDPYAIYARRVLRLKPLNPLVQEPDALLRGVVLHSLFEAALKPLRDGGSLPDLAGFMALAERLLEQEVAWPAARRLWLARLARVAPDFLAAEASRLARGRPAGFERRARLVLDDPGFTLVGIADRIDRETDGRLAIYDYKTGTPPSAKEQRSFDKQLLIEAALAEQAGFEDVGPGPVARAAFLGVGTRYAEVPAPLDETPPARVLADLRRLLAAYLDPGQGFTARRMLHKDSDRGDYDQLARYGEWDRTSPAQPEDLR